MNSNKILDAFGKLPSQGVIEEDIDRITYTNDGIVAEYARSSNILYVRKRDLNGYEALISTLYLNNVSDKTMVACILSTVLNAYYLAN